MIQWATLTSSSTHISGNPPPPKMKISTSFISAPLKYSSFLNMKLSWSPERNLQFGVFWKMTTVEVYWKQEHPYIWYPMREPIYGIELPWKNHIFVQGDGFCNNTSFIGNCTQNGILVCTMYISRFEQKLLLSIDMNSLVKCLPLM